VKLLFRRVAERDIQEARRWYGAHSPALEERFSEALVEIFSRILENPRSYQPYEGSIRRAPLSAFPYVVYYRLKPESVRVLAVLHTKRHPATWTRHG